MQAHVLINICTTYLVSAKHDAPQPTRNNPYYLDRNGLSSHESPGFLGEIWWSTRRSCSQNAHNNLLTDEREIHVSADSFAPPLTPPSYSSFLLQDDGTTSHNPWISAGHGHGSQARTWGWCERVPCGREVGCGDEDGSAIVRYDSQLRVRSRCSQNAH